MLKSEVILQLKDLEEAETRLFIHFEALGADRQAVIHAKNAATWDFLSDLLQSNIEEEGDSDIHSGIEVMQDQFSVIEGDNK